MKSPENPEQPQTPEQHEIARLREENAALRLENERLRELAYTDPLMKIPNRNAYEERKHESPDAILMLDIDNFKIINDAFKEGHPGGDRILQEAGEYLKTQFRDSDFITLYGGDEIVVFLKHADIERLAQRPQLGFTATLDGEQIPITFSGGITTLKPGEKVTDAIHRADTALFAAKEDTVRPDGSIDRGRQRIKIYSDDMEKLEDKNTGPEPTE